MAEWDWRELLDDEEVTKVVHSVWFYAERAFYNGPNDALALDDLSSWLWERAADMAMKYNATLLDPRDLRSPRKQWLAFLYRGLKEYGLLDHRQRWFGKAGTSRQALSPRESIDANLESRAHGSESIAPDIFGNRRLQAAEPLAVILLLERLEEKVASGEPIQEPEPVVDGVCTFAGCDSPSRKRTGLCAMHYRADLDHRSPDCGVEGCTNARLARGLCRNHYNVLWRQRKASAA